MYFSDQLWYTNYFNPTYGLEDINFQSFNQFKIIYYFPFIIYSNIIQNSATDMGDPHVCGRDKLILFN